MSDTIHVFERAGLGKAPFRYMGFSEDRGPKISQSGGVTHTVGAPGQPMGICDFCGTGIADCFHIRSADGKEFKVGCECVKRTDDRGLINVVKRRANKAKRERQVIRERARIAQAQVTYMRPNVRKALRSFPHPNKYRANLGDTAAEMVEFNLRHAGHSGMVAVARAIEKAAKREGLGR